jgi:hypothetical protein
MTTHFSPFFGWNVHLKLPTFFASIFLPFPTIFSSKIVVQFYKPSLSIGIIGIPFKV